MPTPTTPATLQSVLSKAGHVILGKPRELQLALACLVARGHLLIEDVPGLGKTTLAHTLSRLLGLSFSRVQFTSDLLPADILGVSIYERESGHFRFIPGPVFTQVLLADEINRGTPKTQSALLEAMEERQVTVEGETRPLPRPFFVIATQNPSHQIGTFPLPESQLDRFLLRIRLGYPDRQAERQLLEQGDRRESLETLLAELNPEALEAHQLAASQLHASPALLDYVQALLDASRQSGLFRHGLSPRAGLGLLAAARAWAYLEGRAAVLPDDIQVVFPALATHRLQPVNHDGHASEAEVITLMQSVPIP